MTLYFNFQDNRMLKIVIHPLFRPLFLQRRGPCVSSRKFCATRQLILSTTSTRSIDQGVLASCTRSLIRHQRGDWGCVDPEDQ